MKKFFKKDKTTGNTNSDVSETSQNSQDNQELGQVGSDSQGEAAAPGEEVEASPVDSSPVAPVEKKNFYSDFKHKFKIGKKEKPILSDSVSNANDLSETTLAEGEQTSEEASQGSKGMTKSDMQRLMDITYGANSDDEKEKEDDGDQEDVDGTAAESGDEDAANDSSPQDNYDTSETSQPAGPAQSSDPTKAIGNYDQYLNPYQQKQMNSFQQPGQFPSMTASDIANVAFGQGPNPQQRQVSQPGQAPFPNPYGNLSTAPSTLNSAMAPPAMSNAEIPMELKQKISHGRLLADEALRFDEKGDKSMAQKTYMESLRLLMESLQELDRGSDTTRRERQAESKKVKWLCEKMIDRCEQLKTELKIESLTNIPSAPTSKPSSSATSLDSLTIPGSKSSSQPSNMASRPTMSHPPHSHSAPGKPVQPPSQSQAPPKVTSANKQDCNVCGNPNITSALTCEHMFCAKCINRVLNIFNACPVCRAPAKSSDVQNIA